MERSVRARAPWQARAAPGLGVLATCLVAVGSCSLSFSHAGAWAWSPVDRLGSEVDRSLAGALIGTGVTLLVVAWWLLRPGGDRSPSPWLLALWALPLVLVPPVLTGDAFVYADGGWILHAGGDVDADPIASLGGPYAAGVDAFWAGKSSAYPALAVLVGQAAAAGSGYDPYWGVVGQRLVALVALAIAALLLLHVGRRLGVDPAWSVWFGLLNPFVVLHLVGGGHNDAVMIAAALVALAVALQWGHVPAVCWLGCPALIGMAMAVKPQAVVVLVPAMIWPLLERSRRPTVVVAGVRVAAGLLVATATLLGLSLLLGRDAGWLTQLSENGQTPSLGPALIVVEGLQRTAAVLRIDVPAAVAIGTAAVSIAGISICVWLFVTRWRRPLAVAAWSALLLAASTSVLAPWHLTLGLVLLAAVHVAERATRVLLAALVGYLAASTAVTTSGWSGPAVVVLGLVAAGALWLLDRCLGGGQVSADTPVPAEERPLVSTSAHRG